MKGYKNKMLHCDFSRKVMTIFYLHTGSSDMKDCFYFECRYFYVF